MNRGDRCESSRNKTNYNYNNQTQTNRTYNDLSDCFQITNGCPGSYYDSRYRQYYMYNYKLDNGKGPCKSISKAIGSNESSFYDWNKVILMESSEGAHQSDTAAIAVAAKKVWISGENDGVIFKPKDSSANSVTHHVFTVSTGYLRLTKFKIELGYDFSGDFSSDFWMISFFFPVSFLIDCTFCCILYSFVILLF